MYAPHVGRARLRRATAAHALVLAPALAVSTLSLCLTAARDGARDWILRAATAAGPRGGARRTRWYAIGIAVVCASGLLPVGRGLLGLTDLEVVDGIAAGAVVAGLAFIAALLCTPGCVAGSAARVGRVLDGASAGLCLMFACWALLIAPHGRVDSPTFWVGIVTCCLLSTAVIIGLRPEAGSGGRVGAALCAAGVCGAILGLLGLAFALADHLPSGWLVLVGLVLVGSAVALSRGSSRASSGPASTQPVRRAGERAPTSVLLIPAVLAVVVALHRLLTGGAFDRAEMMLGTFAALAVGVRQTFAARAARGPAPFDAPVPTRTAAPEPTSLPAREPAADDPFRRAYLDPVTGLSNEDHLALAVAGLRAVPRSGGAVLVIGTGASGTHDQLRDTAARLRRCCPQSHGECGRLLGRLSDTEFAVLTPDNFAQAYGLAYRIVAALGPTASVGIADLAGGPSTVDVLHRARLAADRAREDGAGQVEWYEPGMEQAVRLREAVASDLPDALRSGQLDLIYQPIMDVARGRPLAVEALLRWRHPRLGTLMPAQVIPVAEQTGLIGDVGRWVLRQASTQLASWRAEGRDLSMSINVSPHGLDGAELVADVTAALSEQRLPADRLTLEFAENKIEQIERVDESFAALRSVGVRTALDAFGTGATSLDHLRRLPIDVVKLDHSLFGTAGPDGAAEVAPVLDVLVGMGRRLGVDVVAQGVEQDTDLKVVRQTRCPFGQGHLWAPARPAEHTEAYLDGFVS